MLLSRYGVYIIFRDFCIFVCILSFLDVYFFQLISLQSVFIYNMKKFLKLGNNLISLAITIKNFGYQLLIINSATSY